MATIDAVRSVGASLAQVFFNAVWPAVLPQWVSSHLYVWEFNILDSSIPRFLDSSILQLIGAGGLGFLITEVTSLCQWGRLSTVLLVVIVLVAIIGANGAEKIHIFAGVDRSSAVQRYGLSAEAHREPCIGGCWF